MAKAAETVSLSEFAEFQGFSQDWIRQLCDKHGMPHRMVRGNYRLVPAKASQWLRERHKQEQRDAESPDEAKERAGKLRAERELKELELAERKATLIMAVIHDTAVETLVGGFSAVAAGQLARFERDIVQATTPAAARLITQRIHAALMQGAQEYADVLETEAAALEQEDAA